jgi:hypothetical protein
MREWVVNSSEPEEVSIQDSEPFGDSKILHRSIQLFQGKEVHPLNIKIIKDIIIHLTKPRYLKSEA